MPKFVIQNTNYGTHSSMNQRQGRARLIVSPSGIIFTKKKFLTVFENTDFKSSVRITVFLNMKELAKYPLMSL